MIEFVDICKRLGKAEILRGLSLRLEDGQLGLLLGPNGAGKTTALRIAAGLLREDAGEFRDASGPLDEEARRARLGYLPQGAAFQPKLTARQLLKFYARVQGAPAEAIDPALEQWGLREHERKASSALSGGLRQRLGLAILSLVDRPVLLLDEPDISLDAEWRERLQAWLRAESRRGKTILVATHLLAEWEGRSDRCLLCQQGRVVEELEPSRLRAEGLPKVRAVKEVAS